MVLLRRCAAGLLLAAGALGLASPGEATPPRPTRSIRLVGSPQVTPGQARLEAMKVEMAWLADIATYGLPLEVQVHGEGLRACGRVPDDAARQQVLEVARQASCLPVGDGLSVAREQPGRHVDAKAMEKAARAALRQHLGDMIAEVQVSTDDQGLVTLRGEVGTVEDKLVASRCLKGLAGCAAVLNALSVTPLRHAGHTVTVVTRDGQHAVHGAMPMDAPGKPAMPRPADPVEEVKPAVGAAQSAPAPYVLPPLPSPTLPSGLPANRMRVQVIRGGNPNDEARPIRYISATGQTVASRGYPVPDGQAQATPVQVAQSSRPGLWERLTSYTRSRSAQETVTPPPAKPAVSEPPLVPTPVTREAAPPVWPKAHATAPAEPVRTSAAPPVSRPLSHLVRVSSKPTPKPEVPKGTLAEGKPVEAAPSKPAEAPVIQPVAKVDRAPAAGSPEGVMGMVQAHCGDLARDVRVETYRDGSMVVKVFAPAANEGRLVSRLLTLPPLPSDKVKLQVVLSR